MKCKNCDCSVVEGDIICPNCGMYLVEQQEPPVPRISVEDRVLEEIPILPIESQQEPADAIVITDDPSDDTDNVYDEASNDTIGEYVIQAEKKMKPATIYVVAVFAAIIIVAALLLCFGSVRAMLVRTFCSPKDFLIAVCQDAGENAVSLLHTAVVHSQNAEKQNNNTQQITIKPSNYLLSLLSGSLSGQSKDMSWLEEINISVSSLNTGDYSQSFVQLGLRETTVLSAVSHTESATGKQWLAFPELSDCALMLSPKKTALYEPKTGLSPEELLDILPDEDTAQLLRQKYMDIFLSGFSVVKKSTEKITLDKITQKVWVIEASATEREYVNMTISFLESLKQDPQVKMMVSQYSSGYTNSDNSYTGAPVDLYQIFIEKLDEELDTCYARLSKCSADNILTFKIFINSRNQIIGFDSVTTTEEEFRILVLFDGLRFALECTVGDNCLSGGGSMGLETYGDFLLTVNQQPYLTVRLEGLSRKNGSSCGQIILEPTAQMLRDLLYDMTGDLTSATMFSMTDISVHVTLTEDLQSFDVVSNGTNMITVEYIQSYVDMEPYPVPDYAVDSTDTNALTGWFATVKWNILFGNLSKSGVPMDSIAALLGSILVDNGI